MQQTWWQAFRRRAYEYGRRRAARMKVHFGQERHDARNTPSLFFENDDDVGRMLRQATKSCFLEATRVAH